MRESHRGRQHVQQTVVLGMATVPDLVKPEEILDKMELVQGLGTCGRFLGFSLHHSILFRAILHHGKNAVTQSSVPLSLSTSMWAFISKYY